MKKWILLPSVFLVTVAVWLVARRMGPSAPPGPELVVYGYSSFVASWGAGPALAKEFEKSNGVRVRLVEVGDARLLAQRVETEREKLGADLLIGFDQYTIQEVKTLVTWRSVDLTGISWDSNFPKAGFGDGSFVPYDWAPLAMIYRAGEVRPPTSLEDLVSPDFKGAIVLMDPRTSTPGYQFLEWVIGSKGEGGASEFFKSLKTSVISYSPSWSSAYGLFKKKEAKLVFSYLTSPVYHWKEDGDRSYQAAVFEDGHPYQVEYAAIPASCRLCAEAQAFVRYLLSAEAQKILMESNTMLPVVGGVREGTLFSEIPKVKLLEPPTRDHRQVQTYQELWKAIVK